MIRGPNINLSRLVRCISRHKREKGKKTEEIRKMDSARRHKIPEREQRGLDKKRSTAATKSRHGPYRAAEEPGQRIAAGLHDLADEVRTATRRKASTTSSSEASGEGQKHGTVEGEFC